jgi:hypothetical protein
MAENLLCALVLTRQFLSQINQFWLLTRLSSALFCLEKIFSRAEQHARKSVKPRAPVSQGITTFG